MLMQKIANAFLSKGSIIVWGWCYWTILILGGSTLFCFNYHEATHRKDLIPGSIATPWLLAAIETVELISLVQLMLYMLTQCDVLITILRRSHTIRNNVPFEYFDRIARHLLVEFAIFRFANLGLYLHISFQRLRESGCPVISTILCVNYDIAVAWFMIVILVSKNCCRFEVYHYNKKLLVFVYVGVFMMTQSFHRLFLLLVTVIWTVDFVFRSFNRSHNVISAAVLMDHYLFLRIRRTALPRDIEVAKSNSASLSVRNLSQYTLNSHHTDDSNSKDVKAPMSLVVADRSDCSTGNPSTESSDLDIFLHKRYATSGPGIVDRVRSMLTNWNQKILEQHEGTIMHLTIPSISHINSHPLLIRDVDETHIYMAINVVEGGWTWHFWGILALATQEVPCIRIQLNGCKGDFSSLAASSRRRESVMTTHNSRLPLHSITRHNDQESPRHRSAEFFTTSSHKLAPPRSTILSNNEFSLGTDDVDCLEPQHETCGERRLASAQAYPVTTELYAFEQAAEQLVSFEPLPQWIDADKYPNYSKRNERTRFMRSKTTDGTSTRTRAICKTALTNMGSLESSFHRSFDKPSNADQQRVSISPITQVVEITSSKSSEVVPNDDVSDFTKRDSDDDSIANFTADRFETLGRKEIAPPSTLMHGKIIGQPRNGRSIRTGGSDGWPVSEAHGSSLIEDPDRVLTASETCTLSANSLYAKCITEADIIEGTKRRRSNQSPQCACRPSQSTKNRSKLKNFNSRRQPSSKGILPLTNLDIVSPTVTIRGQVDFESRGNDSPTTTSSRTADKLSLINIHKNPPESMHKCLLQWDQKLTMSLPVYGKTRTSDGSRHLFVMCADYGIYKALTRIKGVFADWTSDNRSQLERDTSDLLRQQLQKSSMSNKNTREHLPYRKNEKFDSLFATFYKFVNGMYNLVLLCITPLCVLAEVNLVSSWTIAVLMTCHLLSVVADGGRIAEHFLDNRLGYQPKIARIIDTCALLITIIPISANYINVTKTDNQFGLYLSGRIGLLRLEYTCSDDFDCTRSWVGSKSGVLILIGLAIGNVHRAVRNLTSAYWFKSDAISRSHISITHVSSSVTLDCIWVISESDNNLLQYVHDSLLQLTKSLKLDMANSQMKRRGRRADCCHIKEGDESESSHNGPLGQETSSYYNRLMGRDFTIKIVIPPYLKNKWAWFQYPIFDVVTSNSHAVLKSCIQKRNASLNRGAKIRLELGVDHKTGKDVACCWQDLKDYVKIISKNNGDIHMAPI